jgi:hypothetical protein
MHAPDPALVLRIERLERTARRWRRAALFLPLVLAVALAAGAARPQQGVIESGRFVLRGAGGEELGALGADPSGRPFLLLQHEGRTALLTLVGPGLLLRGGAEGRRGAFLGVDTKGDARLELVSDRLVDGVRLVSRDDGTAGAFVLGPDGRDRASMELVGVREAGKDEPGFAARLGVNDEVGRVRAQLGLDPLGNAYLVLLDQLLRRRAGLLVPSGGEPHLSLLDQAQRERAELQLDADGIPSLRLLREDGGAAFEAP